MTELSFNYERLIGLIYSKGHNISGLSSKLLMSRQSLDNKLHNKRDFKQSEILEIADFLGIDQKDIPMYFFTPNVDKC